MGTDIEKLVDLMIQERMQSQFAKWREAETGKEKKADYLRLETEYEKAISALSEEQKNAVRHYCDSIFDSGAESECFFYRLGLKDGIRLWKFRVNPKFCVNSIWGANRAKFIQGGSREKPAAAFSTT